MSEQWREHLPGRPQVDFYLGRLVLNVGHLIEVRNAWSELVSSAGGRLKHSTPIALRQLDLRNIGLANKASAFRFFGQVQSEQTQTPYKRWAIMPYMHQIGNPADRRQSAWDRRIMSLILQSDAEGEPVSGELAAERDLLRVAAGSPNPSSLRFEGRLALGRIVVPRGQYFPLKNEDFAQTIQEPIEVHLGGLAPIQEGRPQRMSLNIE